MTESGRLAALGIKLIYGAVLGCTVTTVSLTRLFAVPGARERMEAQS
ncbi:hypothetical protein [Novosphingobium album (ex Hu et al. 2023)]|uniref:Uncharacterized protein n=1 Tax=Novosphingobium album (ex Hu et al. 2023) TaxID=2930093 RepID=A0ABT0B6L0_9SPHN|nr:hypothetical protein [Novosphingobium album (ex Hu et al. 2023)]MCJ2180727.1 hypothetical protein [Novosphingobium album (ex Hu et al. 2023)]